MLCCDSGLGGFLDKAVVVAEQKRLLAVVPSVTNVPVDNRVVTWIAGDEIDVPTGNQVLVRLNSESAFPL
jgi:hypothetical protein